MFEFAEPSRSGSGRQRVLGFLFYQCTSRSPGGGLPLLGSVECGLAINNVNSFYVRVHKSGPERCERVPSHAVFEGRCVCNTNDTKIHHSIAVDLCFLVANTDPRRLCVRGGPKVVDLCSARAKHRATQLVLVFFESGSWICGSVFLARGVGHRGRCFYDLNANTGC